MALNHRGEVKGALIAGLLGVLIGAGSMGLFFALKPSPKVFMQNDSGIIIPPAFLSKRDCEGLGPKESRTECVAVDESQALIFAVSSINPTCECDCSH